MYGVKTETIRNVLRAVKENEVISHEQIKSAVAEALGQESPSMSNMVSTTIRELQSEGLFFFSIEKVGYQRVSKEEFQQAAVLGNGKRISSVASSAVQSVRHEEPTIPNRCEKVFTKAELLKFWDMLNIPDHATITISY